VHCVMCQECRECHSQSADLKLCMAALFVEAGAVHQLHLAFSVSEVCKALVLRGCHNLSRFGRARTMHVHVQCVRSAGSAIVKARTNKCARQGLRASCTYVESGLLCLRTYSVSGAQDHKQQ
jgi:hypothetical protein